MQYPGTQSERGGGGGGGMPRKATNCVDVYSVEAVLLLLSCRCMLVKCFSSLKRAKLHLRWKLRSKTCKEEIQLDERQQRPNGTGKKRWWHCLFCHWGASACSCLEIWLALLSGPKWYRKEKVVALFVLPLGCLSMQLFGDLAGPLIRSLLQAGRAFQRIDIVFYRYYETSIKSGTRKRRTKVPSLSEEWLKVGTSPCLPNRKPSSHSDNKADFVRSLSLIVAAGGFSDFTQIVSPNPDTNTGRHDVVPPANNQAPSIVVVLLLVHFSKMKCPKIWMKE